MQLSHDLYTSHALNEETPQKMETPRTAGTSF